MAWQWSPGGALTLASAIGTVLLAVVAWRRRSDSGASWLTMVLLATAVWAAAYSLELASSTTEDRGEWGDLKYVGICALPPAWFAFVSAYTGRSWVRRRAMLLLLVEPLLVLGLLANQRTHDLIRYFPAGSTSRVASGGPLFWPHSVYTYVLLWATTALLVVRLWRLSPLYRRQTTVLAVSLAVPFVLNLLFNLGVPPFGELDLTPFAFFGASVVLVWGVLRFRLVGLRPVARSQVFATMGDPVLTVDPLHRVVDLNAAAAAALSRPAEELLGCDVEALIPRARDVIDAAGEREPVEQDLAGRVFELRASPLTDRWSRPLGTLLMAHDVTERHDAQQRLTHQALHDPLTGAANRTLFFDRLQHALDHATRTRHPVSVLFVDLDDFKAINDSWGHATGDAVLVAVADRLRASVRRGDTVARLGGDEFAILLEDVTADEPAQVADHIRQAVAAPLRVADRRLTLAASLGAATGLDVPADELLRRADEQMYDAKRAVRERASGG